MPIAVTDRIIRGTSGASPFAVAWEDDLKLTYQTVADLTERDAIPEWQRLAKMRVYVISEDKDYRLGNNVTIAGQVWTEIDTSIPADVLRHDDILNVDDMIRPELIGNIFLNSSFVVASEAAMLALTTVTGNFVIRTDSGDVFVKLNNNDPAILADFANITYPGAVLTVNGDIGNVVITLSDLIAADPTAWETELAGSTTITTLSSSVSSLTTSVSTLSSNLTNKADLVAGTVPLAQLPYVFGSGLTRSSNNVKLGGTPLTAHTTIDGDDTYNFILTNLAAFNIDGVTTTFTVPTFNINSGGPLLTLDAVAGVTLNVGSDALGDIYYRNSGGKLTRLGVGSNNQFLRVSGGIPSWQTVNSFTSLGTVGQIPFMNSGGTDFQYSSRLVYNTTINNFVVGTNITTSGGTDNFYFGLDHTDTAAAGTANRWNFALGEAMTFNNQGASGRRISDGFLAFGFSNTIHITSGAGVDIFNGGIIGGGSNLLEPVSTCISPIIVSGQDNVSKPTSIAGGRPIGNFILAGQNNLNDGHSSGAMGYYSQSSGVFSLTFGFVTTYGTETHTGTVPRILASGKHAINFSANSPSQTNGFGALSDYSGIYSGIDGNIPSTSPRTVLIGGNGLVARPNDADQVYVTNMNIFTGLYMKSGTDKAIGTATLSAGTVTVNTNRATSTCRIIVTGKGQGGNVGSVYEDKTSRVAGTSFVIKSTNVSDSQSVDWLIIEEY